MTNRLEILERSPVSTSVSPSPRYSCPGSPLMLTKGSTTMEGLSGKGRGEEDSVRYHSCPSQHQQCYRYLQWALPLLELESLHTEILTESFGLFRQQRIDVKLLSNILQLWLPQRDDCA